MDQAVRNKLRNVVTQCRKLLERAIAEELQGRFGIYAAGRKGEVHVEDQSRMAHLPDEDRSCRQELIEHLNHIQALGYKPVDALAQLIREIAFTHLNRLCAYKMMEERNLVREVVSRGLKSQGFLFYLADHPEHEKLHKSGQQDVAYRHFLDWLGGTLSEEIGVLFNPNDPANRVYPPHRVVDEVLALVNSDDLAGIWTEDETIGWVYQYFTPRELRDKARKESQAPRNSYELAFRNQFFTPRYVVEFLGDNTLGRMWYESQKGETSLKDRCRFLVRRQNEVFLNAGEEAGPETHEGIEGASHDEILNRRIYVPHRSKKDPREIRILDPACGSGHFLLYCFDLLQIIYEEAYEDLEFGSALRENYSTVDDLRKAVPGLILKHNLHGIDIDLRATQIAALALWLRCQRVYQDRGLANDERPKITRTNIVCAEPMPGESDLLREFTATLEPRVLGQLVEDIFEKMELAGEAGSLLKIEIDIKETANKAKVEYAKWRKHQEVAKNTLFPDLMRPEQPNLFDFADLTDETFFFRAEEEILGALRRYSEKASNGTALRKRLFAEDAARGFALIELCHHRYDVVLMNPPFGELPVTCKKYLSALSVRRPLDAYAQFVYRAHELASADASVMGAILSKTFLSHAEFESLRRWLLEPSCGLRSVVDLGGEVLDSATVETALIVVQFEPMAGLSVFIDAVSHADKEGALEKAVGLTTTDVHLRSRSNFHVRPGVPFSYRLSQDTIASLRGAPMIQDVCDLCWGLFTANDARFCRLWWEVEPRLLNQSWLPFAKGGDTTPFYGDIDLVVDWSNGGANILEQRAPDGRVLARAPNRDRFGTPGLTFSSISSSGLRVRVLPAGTIFSIKGPGLFAKSDDHVWPLLEILNTAPISHLLSTLSVNRSAEINYVKRISIPADWQQCFSGEEARSATTLLQQVSNRSELSRLFWGLECVAPEQNRENADEPIEQVFRRIENIGREAFSGFGFSSADTHRWQLSGVRTNGQGEGYSDRISYLIGCIVGRWDMRTAMSGRDVLELPDPFAALPCSSPGMLQGSDGLPAKPEDLSRDYPIKIDWDGILVDDPEHTDDIVRRVRDALEVIWAGGAEAIEKEACECLGVRVLRDYFRRPSSGGFWADHVKRYSKNRRKAPIYWYLRSARGNYGLWLYYHRLDKDILFKALLNYVEPKIRLEEDRLNTLRTRKEAVGSAGREAKQLESELDRQQQFVSELHDFKDKLRRAADLHITPDLNDGVVLNIAPLWELVPWKEAKKYWDALQEGKYDWSHIAYQLWPDRVEALCRKNRSVAIAHGREDLWEGQTAEAASKKRVRK